MGIRQTRPIEESFCPRIYYGICQQGQTVVEESGNGQPIGSWDKGTGMIDVRKHLSRREELLLTLTTLQNISE